MSTTYTPATKKRGENWILKNYVLRPFTMDAADAVVAAEMVQCDEIVGVHFDTFPPIKIDHQQATRRFQEAGKRLHLLKIGESRKF